MKMKLMSLFALMMVAMTALSTAAFAEGAREKKGPVAKLREVVHSLSLTDEQKGQIDPILSELETKIAELREETKAGTDEEKKAAREKGREMMKASMEKIAALLTDEQKQELREKVREMRERRDGPRDGKGKGKGAGKGEKGEGGEGKRERKRGGKKADKDAEKSEDDKPADNKK
jgi:Spy/CpxP family protein refolding chaperone